MAGVGAGAESCTVYACGIHGFMASWSTPAAEPHVSCPAWHHALHRNLAYQATVQHKLSCCMRYGLGGPERRVSACATSLRAQAAALRHSPGWRAGAVRSVVSG